MQKVFNSYKQNIPKDDPWRYTEYIDVPFVPDQVIVSNAFLTGPASTFPFYLACDLPISSDKGVLVPCLKKRSPPAADITYNYEGGIINRDVTFTLYNCDGTVAKYPITDRLCFSLIFVKHGSINKDPNIMPAMPPSRTITINDVTINDANDPTDPPTPGHTGAPFSFGRYIDVPFPVKKVIVNSVFYNRGNQGQNTAFLWTDLFPGSSVTQGFLTALPWSIITNPITIEFGSTMNFQGTYNFGVCDNTDIPQDRAADTSLTIVLTFVG